MFDDIINRPSNSSFVKAEPNEATQRYQQKSIAYLESVKNEKVTQLASATLVSLGLTLACTMVGLPAEVELIGGTVLGLTTAGLGLLTLDTEKGSGCIPNKLLSSKNVIEVRTTLLRSKEVPYWDDKRVEELVDRGILAEKDGDTLLLLIRRQIEIYKQSQPFTFDYHNNSYEANPKLSELKNEYDEKCEQLKKDWKSFQEELKDRLPEPNLTFEDLI